MAGNIKIFSFFSGCGFLDLGFENTGYEIVYVNEYSKDFLSAYKYSRAKLGKKDPILGFDSNSIRSHFSYNKKQLLAEQIKKFRNSGSITGFIGGPPCPDFANGGLNNGKDGSSGKLSSAYINLIIKQQPCFFLFENVKGLYQTKKHRQYFEKLKSRLHKAGYVTSEQLLNALEYGVPQHRERLIFVGFRRELFPKNSPMLLDENHIDIEWEREKTFSIDSILKLKWPTSAPFAENSRLSKPRKVIDELTIEAWFKKNQVHSHPNAAHRFTPKAKHKFSKLPEGDLTGKSFKRLHRWKYSPTACYGNNEVHLHPYEARRISVAEALAIQSMPKEFELPPEMSLTNMYKTIGNGVPYLAAKGVATTLSRVIEELQG